jgi:hypothetical protein
MGDEGGSQRFVGANPSFEDVPDGEVGGGEGWCGEGLGRRTKVRVS